MKLPKSEQGLAPIIIVLIVAVGILAFVLTSSTLPFKNDLLDSLFPKPTSEAKGKPWWWRFYRGKQLPGPTISPTPAPAPTSTPTPAPSPVSQGKPVILTAAGAYEGSKSILTSSDFVVGQSLARQQGYPDTPISDDKFNLAISSLNAIPSGSINKSVIFSSIADIKTYINRLPSDVTKVAYNSETALTPASERADFYASVKEGADVVHKAGKKFGFGPLRGDFDKMQENGELAKILPLVDGIGYQGQLLYLSVGEDETVSTAKGKYTYVKSINPNVSFQFQLWVGRQTTSEIISTFNKMKDHMNIAVIGGTSSSSDIMTILDGLSWR